MNREGLASVYITLGFGAELGINFDGQLIVVGPSGETILLGRATLDRMNALHEYINRLKCHAVEPKFGGE